MQRLQKQHFFLILMLSACIVATTSCSREREETAQGYVEGRYTYVATSVSGILKNINVVRGNEVKQGDVLFTLDPQPQSDEYNAQVEKLRQAIASRDAIAANLEYAKITYERYRVLVPKHAIQQSQLDNAKSVLNATQAQLAQANAAIATAQAELAQSKWSKEQKEITAPIDAIVFDTYYRIGEFTDAQQPILSLLAPADIKAIFFINETVLGALKIGDEIKVTCDGCRNPIVGHISFISPNAEYTPPVIFSESTNYKLVYRIEAAFTPQNATQLHPGQPIRVQYAPHG